MEKKFLILDDAAAYLGLSKSYLYKLIAERKIKHYKPAGKKIYFDRDDLDNYIQQNCVNTASEIAEKAQSYCMKKGGFK